MSQSVWLHDLFPLLFRAEKYIKEAEDDVSIVVAPTSFRTAHTTDHSLPQ